MDVIFHAANGRGLPNEAFSFGGLRVKLGPMQRLRFSVNHASRIFAAGLLMTVSFGGLYGQTPPAPAPSASSTPLNWTAQQDHKNMIERLGIKRLRPGPSGNANAPTNAANYDVAKANPFPDLPDPLTLKNGHKVTTAEMWWKQRRPEIAEDFEREIIGRVPKIVPKVTWTIVTQATDRVVGTFPVAAKQLIGDVDNSACPSIKVGIQMTLVTPANAKGPVPVLMMFGGGFGGGFPRRPGEPAPTNRSGAFGGFGGTNAGPSSTEMLIAAG